MDRGKRPGKFLSIRNNKIYMDLKDIIRENALRFLPAKSLFRFQGVCRDWKLQVSAPFFVHNQSLSFRAISGLFHQSPGHPPSFIPIDPISCGVPDPQLNFLPIPVDIRSSSNGLLCCQGRTEDRPYYICNPVTQKSMRLPKPNADHGPNPAIVLVFEPSLLNFVAEYKLICPFQSNDFDDAIEFEIYSSKEGSWKVSGEIFFANPNVVPRSGVHVNGIVYWESHRGVFSFDLTKDRAHLMPDYYLARNTSMLLMDGKLCLASSNSRTVTLSALSNVHSNTMQMDSGARMWEVTKRINLDSAVSSGSFDDNIVVMHVNGDLVLLRNARNLYTYELSTRETKVLCELPGGHVTFILYSNSLVCI